ncbi:MAG: hypothetical protein WKG07_20070 [Hymenobacter sp.]
MGALGAQGFGEVVYPLHVREPAVENFIRFLGAPVRVASQSGQQGPWVELINAGYTRLLPSTPAVLFEYDRNREFFETGGAAPLETDAPLARTGGTAAAVPLRLPAAVHEAAGTEAALGPYIVLLRGPAPGKSALAHPALCAAVTEPAPALLGPVPAHDRRQCRRRCPRAAHRAGRRPERTLGKPLRPNRLARAGRAGGRGPATHRQRHGGRPPGGPGQRAAAGAADGRELRQIFPVPRRPCWGPRADAYSRPARRSASPKAISARRPATRASIKSRRPGRWPPPSSCCPRRKKGLS